MKLYKIKMYRSRDIVSDGQIQTLGELYLNKTSVDG